MAGCHSPEASRSRCRRRPMHSGLEQGVAPADHRPPCVPLAIRHPLGVGTTLLSDGQHFKVGGQVGREY